MVLLRGMVFMDHMNFEICLQSYYKSLNAPIPKLDYNKLFKNIIQMKSGINFLKTFIFAAKPDDFLMQDEYLRNHYKWIQGLNSSKYIDVIEGRYIARPVREEVLMDINDRSTYYKVEKGTDINLAVHVLSKAHFNSYDVAFIMSVDTDHITVYRQLKNIGKIVILVSVEGQYFGKIAPEVDDYLILRKEFFDTCIRNS